MRNSSPTKTGSVIRCGYKLESCLLLSRTSPVVPMSQGHSVTSWAHTGSDPLLRPRRPALQRAGGGPSGSESSPTLPLSPLYLLCTRIMLVKPQTWPQDPKCDEDSDAVRTAEWPLNSGQTVPRRAHPTSLGSSHLHPLFSDMPARPHGAIVPLSASAWGDTRQFFV